MNANGLFWVFGAFAPTSVFNAVYDHQRIAADLATLPLMVTVPEVCAEATTAVTLTTTARDASFKSCLIVVLI